MGIENLRAPVTSTAGLQIPKENMGVGTSTEQQVHHEWDTHGEVEDRLKSQGFFVNDPPPYERPLITEEVLTTEDNKLYSKTFAQQYAWFNYASQLLARSKSMLLQAENEMSIIEAKITKTLKERKRNGGVNMSEKEIRHEVILDVRYGELMHIAQEWEQYKIMLEADVEALERGLKTISRQVEIKKIDMEQGRTNIPGRDNMLRRPRGTIGPGGFGQSE